MFQLPPVLNNVVPSDVSSIVVQVNNAERGFSVLSNGPLDMRMNPQVL